MSKWNMSTDEQLTSIDMSTDEQVEDQTGNME